MRRTLFSFLSVLTLSPAVSAFAEALADAPPLEIQLDTSSPVSETFQSQPPNSLWGKFTLVPRDRLAAKNAKKTQTYSLLDFAKLLGKQAGWWQEDTSAFQLGFRLKQPATSGSPSTGALDSTLGRIGEFSIHYLPGKGPWVGFGVGQQPTDATSLKLETYYRWELGVKF